MPPEHHSAQPGPGVRQERVLEVLVCQLPAQVPPPPGLGCSPSRPGGWHKLEPAVQIQPVSAVETHLCLHHPKISSECVNEF